MRKKIIILIAVMAIATVGLGCAASVALKPMFIRTEGEINYEEPEENGELEVMHAWKGKVTAQCIKSM